MEATMNIKRNLLIVSLLVVLVLPTSFAFAAGIEDVKGVNFSNCESYKFDQTNSVGFSGDDLYDSAASLSGSEVDHVTSFPWEVAISFPCAEARADINTFPANPLSFWSPQIYADVAPASAEINSFSANPELSVAQFTTDVTPVSAEIDSFSANPLSFWSPQIYADVAPVSGDPKDCSADCYDNY